MKNKYIVIGGVAAGMSAASRIRKIDKESEITVFEKGNFISYSACSMPYFIGDKNMPLESLLVLTPEVAEKERGIKVKTNCTVVKIWKNKKTIQYIDNLTKKDYELEYDRLVIATGASAIKPPIDGVDNNNVFVLDNLTNGKNIKEYIINNNVKNASIVGAGLIGLEMCEALRKLNINVNLFEIQENPLKNFHGKIIKIINDKLKENKVNLIYKTVVNKIEKDYLFVDNKKIKTELTLLSTGIKPNSKLAKDAGIELGIKNAISVDSKMETSISGIFAAGDCTESLNTIVNKKVYQPLGTVANKQGRVAGINAAKGFARFKGVLGSFQLKMFDLEIAKTGFNKEELSEYGVECEEIHITAPSTAHGYVERNPIDIIMTCDKRTGKLMGVQMIGKSGVAHRINIVATALYNDMTVEEFSNMDLAYAPPFSPVWDPLLVAANVLKSKVKIYS